MRVRVLAVSAILCVLSTATGCRPAPPPRVEAPPDSASGEVAFELAGAGGAALLVPVYINGDGPFHFALDTGATLTCLDHELVERLALPESRVRGVGANVQGSGRMRLMHLDSVRIGHARAQELLACELDLGHTGRLGIDIQGLVGLNFLKSFRVTLDFERKVLRLQKAEGTPG